MRVVHFLFLWLALFVCVMADDFILGERQEGDYVVTDRTVWKPSLPWPMRATIGVNVSRNEMITHVRISNTGDKQSQCIMSHGGIGTRRVVMQCFGKPGEGMSLRVEGYAKNRALLPTR